MPPPSPELVLIAAITTVYLRQLSKKRQMAFLREVGQQLDWYDEYANLVRIRPRAEDASVRSSRRTAAEWWRRMVGVITGAV